MSKKGFCMMIIGRMGSGKSPLAKEFIGQSAMKKKIVFDKRQEYDESFERFYDADKFLRRVEVATNAGIIFEEATTIMDGYNKRDYLDFVTGIQHNCSVAVFLFHSIKLAPQYLMDLCKYIVLLDIGDSEEDVKAKDKRLLRYLNAEKPVWIDTYNREEW